MKDDYTTSSRYLTYTFLFKRFARMYSLDFGVKGLSSHQYRRYLQWNRRDMNTCLVDLLDTDNFRHFDRNFLHSVPRLVQKKRKIVKGNGRNFWALMLKQSMTGRYIILAIARSMNIPRFKSWPNSTPNSNQLEPSFQLGWSCVSFGHPLGFSWIDCWLEFGQVQIFAQLSPSCFVMLGDCAVVVRQLNGFLASCDASFGNLARAVGLSWEYRLDRALVCVHSHGHARFGVCLLTSLVNIAEDVC